MRVRFAAEFLRTLEPSGCRAEVGARRGAGSADPRECTALESSELPCLPLRVE